MNRRHFLTSLASLPLAAKTQPAAKITRIRISTLQGRFHRFVAMNAYDKVPKGHTYEHSLFRIETDQGVEGICAGPYTNFHTAEFAASIKTLIGANVFDLYQMDQGR